MPSAWKERAYFLLFRSVDDRMEYGKNQTDAPCGASVFLCEFMGRHEQQIPRGNDRKKGNGNDQKKGKGND